MTSPTRRRPHGRLPSSVLLALLVTASYCLLGWTPPSGVATQLDDPVGDLVVAPASAAPTTTTTPTARPILLPVPEDAPADPYADTPEVVHGTLSLPTIGVTQNLYEGVTLTAINRGPSHWPGTAMPGRLGNVVVAGHRTTYTQPFHDLDLLAPGDPLVFTMNDGTVWTYELTGTTVVDPDGMHIVDQTPESTATLFACHPKGSAAQRIVGHFRLVTSPA